MLPKKGTRSLRKVGLVASANLINLDIVVSFVAELIRQREQKWGFTVAIAGEVKGLINLNDPVQAQVANHPDVEFLGFVDEIDLL